MWLVIMCATVWDSHLNTLKYTVQNQRALTGGMNQFGCVSGCGFTAAVSLKGNQTNNIGTIRASVWGWGMLCITTANYKTGWGISQILAVMSGSPVRQRS